MAESVEQIQCLVIGFGNVCERMNSGMNVGRSRLWWLEEKLLHPKGEVEVNGWLEKSLSLPSILEAVSEGRKAAGGRENESG